METLNKIINLLEKFFEKYFFSTIISIFLAFIIYIFSNENFWILLKLGKENYVFVVTLGIFILIEFVKLLYFKVSKNIKERKLNNSIIKQKKQKTIESYKEFIDGLDLKEKELLKIFLNNNNSDVIMLDTNYDNEIMLNYCNYTQIIIENDCMILNPLDLSEIDAEKGMYAYKYKLKKDFYDDLIAILKSGENISNFEI